MGEQTTNLTALMEKLLSRFDDEKLVADKRAEEQAAFNMHVSKELQNLSKQIGLTQAEVDDVCKAASPSASSTPSTASQVVDPLSSASGAAAPHPGAPPLVQPHLHTPSPESRAAPSSSALPIAQALTATAPFA